MIDKRWWPVVGGLVVGIVLSGAGPAPSAETADSVVWLGDYGEAMKLAELSNKYLLVYFRDETASEPQRHFETRALTDPRVTRLLGRYVPVRVPVGKVVSIGGELKRLLDHPAFVHMEGHGGLAVIDLRDSRQAYYRHVVSVYPWAPGEQVTVDRIRVLLDLPPGTLTQRTLIFAVRTHPERPGAAWGEVHPVLAHESERHSFFQARLRRQGHHNWESRFHQINARLPAGMMSQEVCAESWPGQGLLAAARECVRSWRMSSGHWSAVQARQPLFAFDMKQGSDGTWYATGIFARYR